MKTIKPQRLGILHKTFERDRSPTLVVTALLYVALDRRLVLPEVGMWKSLAEEIGDAPLDECMPKQNAEAIVDGWAYPPAKGARTGCPVRLSIGRIDKTLYAVGDRQWTRTGEPGPPQPFDRVSLGWSSAFGGDEFADNPVGKGFAPVEIAGKRVQVLPNLEAPQKPMASPGDRPRPVSFASIPMQWPHRFRKVGTYDEQWQKELAPGFARDIDWTYFNTASDDQQQAAPFAPDEAFVLENMHPTIARLEGRLPGAVARVFIVRASGDGALTEVPTRIDTVRFFPHLGRAVIAFRGAVPVVEDDASDVSVLVAAVEEAGAPRPLSHYEEVVRMRHDKKLAALHALSDRSLVADALMPSAADEAIEDPVSEHAELVKSGNLLGARAQAKAAAEREAMRLALKDAGLDPAVHPLPPPPPEPPPPASIEELPAIVEAELKKAEEERQRASQEQERAEAEARAICEQHGVDYDAMVDKARKEHAGPPAFTADGELDRMRETAVLFRNIGKPNAAAEALLSSPELKKKLETMERELRARYRNFCHHFPAADRRRGEEGKALGAELLATVARGDAVAERDFTGANLAGAGLGNAKLERAWLEAADLTGADLRSADLTGAVLARADLTDADLRGAKLSGANLGEANLTRARLDGCVMTGTVLVRAELTETKLVGAQIVGADLTEARFVGTDLGGATLGGSMLYALDLSGVSAVGVDMAGCHVIEVSLRGADLSEAKLGGTSFVTVDASGARFTRASMVNVRFVHGSKLDGAVFEEADCSESNFRGATMTAADLRNARLDRSDFSTCDLEKARFDGASAKEALFIGTNLRGASLRGFDFLQGIAQRANVEDADFRGANLFRVDLAKIRGNDATRFDGANMKFIRFVERRGPRAGTE